MRAKIKQFRFYCDGSILVLVVVSLVILTTLGLGLLSVAYGVRHQALRLKNEAAAMLAAEAGYEKAIFWMSQQWDILRALQQGADGMTGSMNFPNSDYDYSIGLYTFIGCRPVYQVISNGHSGMFNRTVDVYVIQAISGWDMGKCRVPTGSSSTTPVYYADGEIIDMPLHINNLKDSPDRRDIYIIGSPQFKKRVSMGESKGSKYPASIMSLFEDGIDFDQPDCRIANEDFVQSKVDRFEESTKEEYQFTPAGNAPVSNPQDAVQLEFFVDGGVGKVRITNNSIVRGHQESSNSRTYDFRIKPDSDGKKYERYDIYAYHLRPDGPDAESPDTIPVEDTYVTQSFGDVESEPGGQIFVNGNVIIGSGDPCLPGQDVIKGKITVVATGNIWIADSSTVSDYDDSGTYYPRDADNMPVEDNPNILGLIAQGVIKVVDPGMSENVDGGTPDEPEGFKYIPIGRPDNPAAKKGDSDYNERHLPDPTVLEAAITVGGGGWGAENVYRTYTGLTGRKEASGNQDYLIVRGTIVEAVRGVVGRVNSDGYIKRYYFDERLLTGILPGDIWLRGKYIPAPAGWHDYRPSY